MRCLILRLIIISLMCMTFVSDNEDRFVYSFVEYRCADYPVAFLLLSLYFLSLVYAVHATMNSIGFDLL